jgi:hypothetical protein
MPGAALAGSAGAGFDLGLGSPPRSTSFSVSPNYKIPANPFQSLDFRGLNSND